jgi:hypothetical protein
MLRRSTFLFAAASSSAGGSSDWYHSSANNRGGNKSGQREEHKSSNQRESADRFVPPSEAMSIQRAYQIFSVKIGDNLTQELINKKYKILAKKHHPDKGGKPEDFQALKEAHKLMLSVKHEPKHEGKVETKFTRVTRAETLDRVDNTNLDAHRWDVTDAFAVLVCVPLALALWYWHNNDITVRLSDSRRRMGVDEMRPQKREDVAMHEWHPWRASNDEKRFITDVLEDRTRRLGLAANGYREGSTPYDEALQRANEKSDDFNKKYDRPVQVVPPKLTKDGVVALTSVHGGDIPAAMNFVGFENGAVGGASAPVGGRGHTQRSLFA